MASNPYQAPLDGELDLVQGDPFPEWTTWKMVALFFLPAAFLFIALLGAVLKITPLVISGFVICGCAALAVTLFSARVHQRRQNGSRAFFFLMTLVYLIAQIFAIFLAIACITVIMENFVHRSS